MQYPPQDICRQLAAFHPQLRLGWDSEHHRFGLVQLYNRRAAKTTFRDRWGSRGTLFSKTGRPAPDWDAWSRVPMYIIDIPPRDVFSGKVLKDVKHWVRPVYARVYKSAMEERREVLRKIDAIGHEAGGEIYRESQARGQTYNIAKKHIDPSNRYKRYKHGSMVEDLADRAIPPAPEGGYDKHVAADEGDAGDLGSISTS